MIVLSEIRGFFMEIQGKTLSITERECEKLQKGCPITHTCSGLNELLYGSVPHWCFLLMENDMEQLTVVFFKISTSDQDHEFMSINYWHLFIIWMWYKNWICKSQRKCIKLVWGGLSATKTLKNFRGANNIPALHNANLADVYKWIFSIQFDSSLMVQGKWASGCMVLRCWLGLNHDRNVQ